MPQPSRHILFVTGGTEGHLYPLLAVAEACHQQAAKQGTLLRTSYVGTVNDMQLPSLAAFQYPLEKHVIHAGKLNRFLTLKQIREFGNLSLGLIEAQFLLQRLRPDVVFAKGSAVSVPVVLAAARLGIPIFSHETDVRPGLSNRIASRYAKKVFTAFPVESYSGIATEKLQYVGQPVRPEFFHQVSGPLNVDNRTVNEQVPCITVIGGSQGARRLNELVAAKWNSYLDETQLVHITGRQEFEQYTAKAKALPAQMQSRLFLAPYLGPGLAFAFQHSSVVISRAGGTIAELAATNATAILVPLSTAAQDHQQANADVLKNAGAVLVVDEREDAEVLAEQALKLLHNDNQRHQLSKKIGHFSKPDAAAHIADTLVTFGI